MERDPQAAPNAEEPVLQARLDPTRPVAGKVLSTNPVVRFLNQNAYAVGFGGVAVLVILGFLVISQTTKPKAATLAQAAAASQAPVIPPPAQPNDKWFQNHPDSVAVPSPTPVPAPKMVAMGSGTGADTSGSIAPGNSGTVPGLPPVQQASQQDLGRYATGPSSSTQVPPISNTPVYQPLQPAYPSRTVPNIDGSNGSDPAPAQAAGSSKSDPRTADITVAMSDSKESDTTQVAAGSASAAQHTDGMTAQVTTGDKSDSDYLANQVTAPRSPYELQAGTKIPAVISESVDSDMPGFVNAIVSEDVYDSIRGVYLLIPKGSRLLGQYVSLSGPGQTRTAVAFTRLFFPGTGNYLDLGGMSGADQQGNMGLGGDVDTHNGRLVMTALKLAILQVGTSIGAGQNTSILQAETPAQTAAQAVNTAVGQVGQKILNQDVLPPTLHVRIGTRFNVRVEHDIVFPGPTH